MTATQARKPAPSARQRAGSNIDRAQAVLGSAASVLTAEQRRLVVRYEARMPDLIGRMLAQLDEPVKASDRIALKPKAPAEASQGGGLSEPLSLEEGRRRAHDYALATGGSFESWAGPTSGPVELAARLGVSRSTLHAWQAKGLAIGLINGVRKNVFPLDQFVDGKPVAGIADVLAVITEPQAAWMWLKEPSPLLGGATPLARLKRGHVAEVLRAAQTNYGQ